MRVGYIITGIFKPVKIPEVSMIIEFVIGSISIVIIIKINCYIPGISKSNKVTFISAYENIVFYNGIMYVIIQS